MDELSQKLAHRQNYRAQLQHLMKISDLFQ